MRRSLLFAAAVLSVAAPTLAGAQERGHGGGRGRDRGGEQTAPAQASPAQASQVQAGPSAAEISARAAANAGVDRRRLFTGPNDPAASAQDRATLWNRGPRGDRDGDGVPNRIDRDRNGDGRLDARLRDRDHDGIPNRVDRDRNGDGRVDQRFRDRDRDGVPNYRDRDRNGDGLIDRRYRDADRDGIPNYRDRDRNGDGRPDYRAGQRYRGGWYAGERRAFNYNGRTFYRFRAEPYRWGAYSRYQNYRWSRGALLPRFFLVPDYFITDYYAFGLQPAPYGYQWVRVGFDVLLVNAYTGQIVEVVPGVFWW